jgi:hypothetical protein
MQPGSSAPGDASLITSFLRYTIEERHVRLAAFTITVVGGEWDGWV